MVKPNVPRELTAAGELTAAEKLNAFLKGTPLKPPNIELSDSDSDSDLIEID